MKTPKRSAKADITFPKFQDDFAYPPLPEGMEYKSIGDEPSSQGAPVIGYLMIALILVLVTVVGFTVFGGAA